jgi:Family of unknown function (DUF6325)
MTNVDRITEVPDRAADGGLREPAVRLAAKSKAVPHLTVGEREARGKAVRPGDGGLALTVHALTTNQPAKPSDGGGPPPAYHRTRRVTATREDRTMEASELDVLGPVDYLVVEFPADKANFSGEMAAELTSLVDRDLVRVLDLVILRKDPDGSVEAAELHDVDESNVGELRALEADLAMLLAEEDVEEIGKALEPGSIAAVLVYENSWAGPFASSIRRSGGQLVANGRIPTQALLAAIEADEQSDEEGA